MATQLIRFGARALDTNGSAPGGAINAGSAQNGIDPAWVTASASQPLQQLLALLDVDGNAATGARDARGRLVFGVGADQAFNLSDLAAPNRASSLPIDNTADDPVLIGGHGRLSDRAVGDLDTEVRLSGDAFGVASRVDGPSAAPFLNYGDSLDFAVAARRTLEAATFQVAFREARPGTVVLDVDGDTAVNPGGIVRGFSTDGLLSLRGLNGGDTVRVDFVAETVTVNGAARAVDAGFWAAAAASGRDNLTIGARHDDAGGFSLRGLTLAATPPPPDNPVTAADDAVETGEDAPLAIQLTTLLANDELADGPASPALRLPSGTTAEGGTVALVDGAVLYTPRADFFGPDSFRYIAVDSDGDVDVADVAVTVAAASDPPRAEDDALASVAEDSPAFLVPAELLLANDQEVDGDTLAVIGVEAVLGGTARIEGGDVRFAPTPDFAGPAGFTYVVADGEGAGARARAAFEVVAVNDAPGFTAPDVAAARAEIPDGSPGENATELTASGSLAFTDSDFADQHAVAASPRGADYRGTLTAAVVAAPGGGGGQVDWSFAVADAALDDLAEGQVLIQTYDLVLDDGQGGTATRTVTITLTGALDGPGAIADSDLAADRVLEGAPVGTPVGLDADAAGLGLAFSLADDAQGRFAIDPATGIVTVRNPALLDFESAPAHAVGVRATDAAGLTSERTFIVAVADRPEEFRVSGTPAPSQFIAASSGGEPVAALADGGYLVTWSSFGQDGSGSGIFAQRYAADGAAAGGEFRVNGTAAGDQSYGGAAALADGGFVVTWTSTGQDGSGDGVFAQRYAADGTAQGDEFLVNGTARGNQQFSDAAALADGGFLVTWTSTGQDGSGGGIYGQRYVADGTALGGEFLVNTTTQGSQQFSDATALADGGHLLTWSSIGQDGSGWGIYAQRYAADGTAAGGELQVNATAVGNQIFADAAALADGGYVVTWTSAGQDGSAEGIYAQRYAADGTALGGEFRVNTTTANAQVASDATALADGGFVVAWTSSNQDGSGDGVFAQRFAADGQPVGGEVRVNDTTAGLQADGHLAALADGDLVAAWWGNGLGDDAGILAKRYDADMLLV